MNEARIGIDTGGTFTDVALIDTEGVLTVRKVPSTPADYADGVEIGLLETLADRSRTTLSAVLHATTVGTNAILERKGARTGLITTEGFRDVLELKRMRLPQLYNLQYVKSAPLVPRALRVTVSERMLASGIPEISPEPQDVIHALNYLIVEENVESLAVCFLNSHVNPAHERLVAEIVHDLHPGVPLSISSDLIRETGEYERTSTAVINAYLQPVVSTYLTSLQSRFRARDISAPISVMQSRGGLMTLDRAIDRPCQLIESGPAAGVIAARTLLARLTKPDSASSALVFDMGGTTAKASVIENGEISLTGDYEVGRHLSEWGGFMGGGGYALKVPVIDIAEVGAGGGSLLRVDSGGALYVGPESAGSSPGPACYGISPAPTVTDANVVLGFLNPDHLLGGELIIDSTAARRAIESHIADPLELTPEDVAWIAHVVANSSMMPALKAVTSQRGRDPRDFILVAFGGNGPVHAAGLAQLLEISRVIVPPHPGVMSALGLLNAEHQDSAARPLFRRFDAFDPAELEAEFANLASAIMADSPINRQTQHVEFSRALDLRYVGQGSELTVPLRDGPITSASLATARDQFETEHEATYRHSSHDTALEMVAVRLLITSRGCALNLGSNRPIVDSSSRLADSSSRRRSVFFGPAGFHDTPVLTRGELTSRSFHGPLIIEEYDATTVVPPGCSAILDSLGNIVIDIAAETPSYSRD